MYLAALNWPAIIAAVVANMVLGGLWYAPAVFGKAWMALSKFDPDTAAKPGPAMAKTAVMSLVSAMMLASLIMRMDYWGVVPGALTGVFLVLLLIGPTAIVPYFFENRPVKLFLIHFGNWLVGFALMGGIIGAWG